MAGWCYWVNNVLYPANLLISTACAGVLLFALGLLRLGNLVRFVPVSIVIGFTNGIAVLIGLSQVKDFLGLSTPKQERFMAHYIDRLDARVLLGVGAAFDFHAGRVKQAPRWIQRSGFEWLYRTCKEPRRLWKRYFRNNPLFVWKVFWQLTGVRRYPIETA